VQQLHPEQGGEREDDENGGAFAASVIFSPNERPATARANIAAQIAGLISDSTVMMACSCSCMVVFRSRRKTGGGFGDADIQAARVPKRPPGAHPPPWESIHLGIV
jgi:hypothetical protein